MGCAASAGTAELETVINLPNVFDRAQHPHITGEQPMWELLAERLSSEGYYRMFLMFADSPVMLLNCYAEVGVCLG